MVPPTNIISVLRACARGSSSCFIMCRSTLFILQRRTWSTDTEREVNKNHLYDLKKEKHFAKKIAKWIEKLRWHQTDLMAYVAWQSFGFSCLVVCLLWIKGRRSASKECVKLKQINPKDQLECCYKQKLPLVSVH